MWCILMHKRIPIVKIELDDATGFIRKIKDVYAIEHLPVGITVKKGAVDRATLNEWWTDRSIPASRSGIRDALEKLDVKSTKMLLVRCYGLSLSDQYWICPEGSDITWDNVNFFENIFSDDIGDVLFGANKKENAFDFSSPDNTSDGNLKKRWKIIDGRRCLVKGGSNPFRQQPFNEVIATEIMKRLEIQHVPYTIMWEKGVPYSVCEDFVNSNTELIPAWRIIHTQKKENSTSVYHHFVNCCETLGIKGVVEFLDRMIVLDYIIANEDRHLNNFGALRNAETLEWIGMAPIYDSGSSLGYDKMAAQIHSGKEITCKPFKTNHEAQLSLVSSFDWIDFEALNDVKDIVAEVYNEKDVSEYMDEARVNAIANSIEKRICYLRDFANKYTPVDADFLEDDVEVNVAEDYLPKMTM